LVLDSKFVNENYINSFNKLKQMENFIYHTDSRFTYILRYFGDKKEYKCGKCDNCLRQNEVLPHDAFQFINESVLKTIHYFSDGISPVHVFTVLLGTSKSEGYQKLPIFGICSGFKYGQLKPVFNQLLSNGYIFENKSKANKIFLTNKGHASLLELKLIDDQPIGGVIDSTADLELFFKLKAIREKASLKFTQPPYLICNDEILIQISRIKPKTKDEMLEIEGITERSFNKFGEEILSVINSISVESDLNIKKKLSIPSHLFPIYKMLKEGKTLKEIAIAKNQSETTISMQIEELVKIDDYLDVEKIITPQVFKLMYSKYKEGFVELKTLKTKLGDGYSYPEIRVFLAIFKRDSPTFGKGSKLF
jgi:ATP-dependent DNA helicase RecQ